MRKIISFLLLSFVVYALQAQIKDPVKFKTELTALSDTEAEVVFTATMDKGWHVYSTDLGDGGPISATFNVDNKSGVELVGKLKPVGKEVSTFDKLFEMKVRYFENTAKFVQKVKFTGGAYAIEGYLEYGACDDESCLPPTQVPFKYSGVAKAWSGRHVLDIYIHNRFSGWIIGIVYPLCMADYSDDSQFLLKT